MFLGSQVVDIEEVDVWGIGLLVETGCFGVINGEIDCVIVICVGTAVLWVKMKKERMNKVSAKRAPMMVQQQSVHLRSFYSTGKLRKVKTLFLNMINKNLFLFILFQRQEE